MAFCSRSHRWAKYIKFTKTKCLVRFYIKMTPSLSSVIGLNSDDVISLSDSMNLSLNKLLVSNYFSLLHLFRIVLIESNCIQGFTSGHWERRRSDHYWRRWLLWRCLQSVWSCAWKQGLCLFLPFWIKFLNLFFRSGSLMSLSLSLAKIPSTGISCWRTPRIPQPQGSCVTFPPGRDPRAQTGSVSYSKLTVRRSRTASVSVTMSPTPPTSEG